MASDMSRRAVIFTYDNSYQQNESKRDIYNRVLSCFDLYFPFLISINFLKRQKNYRLKLTTNKRSNEKESNPEDNKKQIL